MTEDRNRQLAAIMFVDMVGYTALMQVDEELARTRRDRHRAVLSATVPAHHGEILQYYGDGTLAVFSSAVKAVECAIEIQLELKRAPEVPVRIGVHTGDIVHDAEGVYGDSVNVAARIEALCEPGGILVSGKVFDEIKNHPALSAVFLGNVPLKNVTTRVELYAISNEGLSVPDKTEFLGREEGGRVGAGHGTEAGGHEELHGTEYPASGAGERFIRVVRERALVQWGLTYAVVAWVVLQAVVFAGQRLGWSPMIPRGLELVELFGFFVAMVIAWFHGERGRQRISGPEVILVGGLLVITGVALSALTPELDDVVSGEQALRSDETDMRPSIAVLPFDNFSPNPDDEYFANGVQEDITSALARVRMLRVPGRSSVERYRESRPSSREIARTLGADYLLEGSARIVSGTVLVTVQLIDGRTDQHLWAEDYRREFSVQEVIAIQSEVAQEVASRLRTIITPEEARRISTVPTANPLAFELFQRARYHWNRRTEAEVQEAIELYQDAIDLDPEFSGAYAGLADAYLVLANWGWADHRRSYASGISAAERALELDPLIASAHASLGGLHLWYTNNWEKSEEHFRRALELDSDYAYGHYWYSALLSALGRHGESIAQASLAATLDPLSPPIAYGYPRSLFIARDFQRSVEETTDALEIHPDYGNLHSLLCSALISLGDYGKAEVACRRHQETLGVSHSLNMGILRAYEGNRDSALAEVEGVRVDREGEGMQPVIVAMVYAGMGEVDEAVGWLEEAVEGEYPHLEYLSTHPFFDPLREDDRFQALLRQVGFPSVNAEG